MSVNFIGDYNREIREWLLRVGEVTSSMPKDRLIRRACPVCGSADSALFANNGHLDYEQCRACTLIFMNPAIPPDSVNQGFAGDDGLLMDYFRIVMKYMSAPAGEPDPEQDNKLRDIYGIKRSGRLLDVGCSTGAFLHRAKFFYDVEGVEINPHTAAVAEQHFRIHKATLASLDLGRSYDVVTLHQILYGVPDPVGLLRDIRNVLQDDGILYINTPNADSYAMRMYQGKANHLYGYTTQNIFNHESLRRLAEVTGFRLRLFRTEWVDIYLTDLLEYFQFPDRFIHKRNSHIEDYDAKIRREDELHRQLNPDLGTHGNYLVAVLGKTGQPPVADEPA